MTSRVQDLPDDAVIVLDGGLSNVLQDAGFALDSELWTAAVLRDAPRGVLAAHRRYFAAGANVATAASYQASVEGFERVGMSSRQAEALIVLSVELAKEAAAEVADRRTAWSAASVGPYGASLADGSEYVGDYGVSASVLRDFHARRLELLASAGPDLLAVETIPDVREAEVLVPLLEELGVPYWFSYSVAGGATRAGQRLDEAFAVLAGGDGLLAAGVNCCAPDDVLPSLLAARTSGIAAGVAYPNAGRQWDGATNAWSGASAFDAHLVPSWIGAGARLIGGCCEIGPSAIADVAEQVRARRG